MIDEILLEAEEKMDKAVSVARDDLGGIRTGRANPGMFSRINIEYYGSMTPITQLSSINVPEARMVVIKPYEASQLRNIEDAIRNSDLGVNPTNDGAVIRVSIPQLTEERRRELVKQAKDAGANGYAVALLHSYANPAHERAVEEAIRTVAGADAEVSLSSEIWPQIGRAHV